MATEVVDINTSKCSTCGLPGELVCCDACPCSFHYACCEPPVLKESIPEGDWYCRSCTYAKTKHIPATKSRFSQLIEQARSGNARLFALPTAFSGDVRDYRTRQREKVREVIRERQEVVRTQAEFNDMAFMRQPKLIKLWQIVTDTERVAEEEVGHLLAEHRRDRELAMEAVVSLANLKAAGPLEAPNYTQALREGGWPATLDLALRTMVPADLAPTLPQFVQFLAWQRLMEIATPPGRKRRRDDDMDTEEAPAAAPAADAPLDGESVALLEKITHSTMRMEWMEGLPVQQ
eukprot:TRINITY_DN13682_c0_g2_i1.p1 TRINITY_DN13682_c0_g2~~TRINITY_DN13682_c0_g2_i1.p1  ORF type:complete len:308 (-),score=43.95 TRINITY_DN13682_c0_g2_i1:1-873(-)